MKLSFKTLFVKRASLYNATKCKCNINILRYRISKVVSAIFVAQIVIKFLIRSGLLLFEWHQFYPAINIVEAPCLARTSKKIRKVIHEFDQNKRVSARSLVKKVQHIQVKCSSNIERRFGTSYPKDDNQTKTHQQVQKQTKGIRKLGLN